MSKSPDPLPFELEEDEGLVKKNGRPKNIIPMKSLLRALPNTADRIEEGGVRNIDFSMTAEVLAVLGAINLENALSSDDVNLKDRVEWTLRLAPFLTQLREGFARKKGVKLPKTTAALAEEMARRSESIKKLAGALGKPAQEAGATAASVVLSEDEDDED